MLRKIDQKRTWKSNRDKILAVDPCDIAVQVFLAFAADQMLVLLPVADGLLIFFDSIQVHNIDVCTVIVDRLATVKQRKEEFYELF